MTGLRCERLGAPGSLSVRLLSAHLVDWLLNKLAIPARAWGVLAGVSILPSGRGWAVGSLGPRIPQITHWNGRAWLSEPLT